MKVAYILTTYPCRSEVFMAREIRCLQQSGWGVTVFAAAPDSVDGTDDAAIAILYRPRRLSGEAIRSVGYLMRCYPLGVLRLLGLALNLGARGAREVVSLLGNLHTIGFIAKHLDRLEIDRIHAGFANWPALMALALSRASGRPFSMGAHARDVFVEPGALELKVSRSTFVSTCSQHAMTRMKAQLRLRYHRRLHLIHHGIDMADGLSARQRSPGEDETQPLILGAGRLVAKKGFADLLRAFALIGRRDACRLVIVGDGPERGCLRRLLKELSITALAEIRPWQDRASLAELMSRAVVLVVPSVIAGDGDQDGIPNVILEAFAVRTPVVATRLPGIMEVVEDNVTGILAEPGDIRSLAAAIERLLDSSHLRERLMQQAHKTVTRDFDIRRNTHQLTELLLGSGSWSRGN